MDGLTSLGGWMVEGHPAGGVTDQVGGGVRDMLDFWFGRQTKSL